MGSVVSATKDGAMYSRGSSDDGGSSSVRSGNECSISSSDTGQLSRRSMGTV